MDDGQLLVDESNLGKADEYVLKNPGDPVFAGSFCVSGRALYQANALGSERQVVRHLSEVSTAKEALTPIEVIIDRVLKVLLLVVVGFTVLLILALLKLEGDLPLDAALDIANVIFSIAPIGLFFMILLTYVAGTVDLAKLGALVFQARSVETLAQVDVMCFTRSGVLTGTRVEVEAIDSPTSEESFSPSHIRQILGDYVRSISTNNLVTQAIQQNFEGSRRAVVEEAPFASVYGWSGAVFNDEDLRGMFVLGNLDILEQFLQPDDQDRLEEPKESPAMLERTRG
ncbi:MAG: hypothetical protein GTO18_00820 [Anaerolineales bacterium]|nr:hypothetical protein [Anaerolineales bacterium]